MAAMNVDITQAQKEFIYSDKPSQAMLCGVSTGKSFIASMFLIKEAVSGNNWIACSQTATSFAKVLGRAIEDNLARFGLSAVVKHNKSDNSFTFPNGAIIQGATAQSINGLTGLTNQSGFLSDESAIIDRRTRDFLEDRCRGTNRNGEPIKPRYRYLGTPPLEGNTEWFKEFCEQNPDCVIRAKTTDMIGKFGITKEFVHHQIKKYGGDHDADPSTWPPLCRAQILGEFMKDSELGKVFQGDALTNLKILVPGVITMGIDMAGSGRDYNIWVVTDGAKVLEIKKVQVADLQTQISVSNTLINKWHVRQVCIDTTGGFGNGLHDVLKTNESLNVLGINFAMAAVKKEDFANARAEMYFQLRDLCIDGFKVGDDKDLLQELNIQTFEVNHSGKTQLIAKETLKELLGRSPDTSDALALACYRRDEAVNIVVAKNSLYKPMRMFK